MNATYDTLANRVLQDPEAFNRSPKCGNCGDKVRRNHAARLHCPTCQPDKFTEPPKPLPGPDRSPSTVRLLNSDAYNDAVLGLAAVIDAPENTLEATYEAWKRVGLIVGANIEAIRHERDRRAYAVGP